MMVKAAFITLLFATLTALVSAGGTNESLGHLYDVKHEHGSSGMKRAVFPRAGSVNLRFPYNQKKMRGVSLGGWLVIENFISPQIYKSSGDNRVIDEWSLGKYVSRDKAEGILRAHYDNFITEDDFKQIASLGLNHVRVPFPYWGVKTYPGDPYIKLNQYAKLKQAAQWAKNHNLKMIIELHTVPGGANPFDHSGHTNHSSWLGNPDYEGRTLEILNTLVSEFSQSKYDSVTAISIVNEPVGDADAIRRFYRRGYNTVRDAGSDSDLLVIIGDVFMNPAQNDYWHDKMQPPRYEGVAVDTHVYRLFDPGSIAMSQEQRISNYCSMKSGFAKANKKIWTMVAEWSPAFTDCAPGLNGRFLGSRYEGTFPGSTRRGSCKNRTGNAENFSSGFIANLRKNWAAQADAYEQGLGWIMWTWKVDNHNADEWSYQAGVRHGWIPRDPTDRSFSC
ncbi:glucan 1,3-beta-glucosidase [Malassezia obtusa]|uniref:Glucan 1,3-beta-glucosidase n=1 Tax=Malassezia obtusa TaxID=76774 RepID=A0AAF0IU48_9BASI|nr:glucan 1,3-beta-glucosidase [Malassezia obtusa]